MCRCRTGWEDPAAAGLLSRQLYADRVDAALRRRGAGQHARPLADAANSQVCPATDRGGSPQRRLTAGGQRAWAFAATASHPTNGADASSTGIGGWLPEVAAVEHVLKVELHGDLDDRPGPEYRCAPGDAAVVDGPWPT